MKFGKRHFVLIVLVLALGTAVYLNWQFSSEKNLVSGEAPTSTKELGEAQFVNNTPSESPKPEENSNGAKNPSEYFSKAKTDRQKARDEATDIIKEILDDAKSSEETKAEAVKKASEIAKRIEQEANIESLIKAKGVAECLAFIQNDECSVVVGGGEALNENLAITIKDIISGQSGISPDKIKIIEAK